MNVSNVSSSNPLNPFEKQRQDFQSLANALQSGDLTGAQNAFKLLQQDAGGKDGSNPNNQNNQLSQDFQTLSDALNFNDLSTAQKAFAAFQKDLQNVVQTRKGGHHHHHQAKSDPNDATSPTNPNAPGGVVNEQA